MKTQELKLTEIKPYEQNAKIHTDDQIAAVANSIKEFGIVQPIVVDKSYTIIIGHCRYEAAKKLKLKTFPVIVAELKPEQARALRLVDNKTNESEWTAELTEEIEKIQETFDLEEFGFSVLDLLELEGDMEPENLDFDDEEFYIENANAQLKATQVTITYESEEAEEWLKKKLNLEKMKVVYQATQLTEN